MTAAEIAKEFARYIGSDDPEWVAKLGNQLQERIEALVASKAAKAMSTPLGSEPAYPLQVTSALTGWTLANHGGLSKREWLAGTIAAGMWANPKMVEIADEVASEAGCWREDAISENAIDAADAILARLAALQPSSAPTHTEATPEPPKAR